MASTTEGLPPLLKVPEAAKFLRISRNVAYAAIRGGSIPSIRVGGSIRVPRSRLLEMVDGRPTQHEHDLTSTDDEQREGDAEK